MNTQPATRPQWAHSHRATPSSKCRSHWRPAPIAPSPGLTRIHLLSEVDSVDAPTYRFVIREYYIRAVCVTAYTRLYNHCRDEANLFALEELLAGDWVEVRGTLQPGTIGPIIASEVIRLGQRSRLLAQV